MIALRMLPARRSEPRWRPAIEKPVGVEGKAFTLCDEDIREPQGRPSVERAGLIDLNGVVQEKRGEAQAASPRRSLATSRAPAIAEGVSEPRIIAGVRIDIADAARLRGRRDRQRRKDGDDRHGTKFHFIHALLPLADLNGPGRRCFPNFCESICQMESRDIRMSIVSQSLRHGARGRAGPAWAGLRMLPADLPSATDKSEPKCPPGY